MMAQTKQRTEQPPRAPARPANRVWQGWHLCHGLKRHLQPLRLVPFSLIHLDLLPAGHVVGSLALGGSGLLHPLKLRRHECKLRGMPHAQPLALGGMLLPRLLQLLCMLPLCPLERLATVGAAEQLGKAIVSVVEDVTHVALDARCGRQLESLEEYLMVLGRA